jgi:hypothetical protein
MMFLPGQLKQATPQDLADRLQREAQAKKLAAELKKVLFNRRGLARLEAITDEEWERAQNADDNATN